MSSCAADVSCCPVLRLLIKQTLAKMGSLIRLCPAVQRSGYLLSAYTPRVVYTVVLLPAVGSYGCVMVAVDQQSGWLIE